MPGPKAQQFTALLVIISTQVWILPDPNYLSHTPGFSKRRLARRVGRGCHSLEDVGALAGACERFTALFRQAGAPKPPGFRPAVVQQAQHLLEALHRAALAEVSGEGPLLLYRAVPSASCRVAGGSLGQPCMPPVA